MQVFLASLNRFIITLFITILPASAGIFSDQETLDEAQRKAEVLKEQIQPGKIIVMDMEGNWCDYSSASLIGKPGDTKTRTVISCAHTFLASLDYDFNYLFCDYEGNTHKISEVNCKPDNFVTLSNLNDIALYYLEEPLPYLHGQKEIARDLNSEMTLSSISYGWTLIEDKLQAAGNLNGSFPFLLTNTYNLKPYGYTRELMGDRLIVSSEKTEFLRSDNLAQKDAFKDSRSQIFLHDSGSIWFSEPESVLGDYFLTALTSQALPIQQPTINITEESDIPQEFLGETSFSWNENNCSGNHTFTFLKSPICQPFENILTPLAPHRDWIYHHCI